MAISNELINAIMNMQRGDQVAFAVFYNETYSYVFGKAKYIMHDEQDALDLTQETYVQAYRGISSIADPNNVYAWLGGIVYRQGMKIFNKKKELLTGEGQEYIFDDLEEESATPEQSAMQNATVRVVQDMIGELPELQRVAVMAYYYDNMKIDDIARMCGCSSNTIKSRLNYAKKFLKEKVEVHEKKYNYKLASLSPTLLLLAFKALFAGRSYAMPVAQLQTVYSGACGVLGIQAYQLSSIGAGAYGASAAGTAGSGSAVGSSAMGTAGTATGTGVGAGAAGTAGVAGTAATAAAGLTVGAKVAIAVAAAVVIAGVGTGAAIAINHNNDTKQESYSERHKDRDKDRDEDKGNIASGDVMDPGQSDPIEAPVEQKDIVLNIPDCSYISGHSVVNDADFDITFLVKRDDVDYEAGESYFSYKGTEYLVDDWSFGISGYYIEHDGNVLLIAMPYSENMYTSIHVYKLDLATDTFQETQLFYGTNIEEFHDVDHIKMYINTPTVGFNGGTMVYHLTSGGLETDDTQYDMEGTYAADCPLVTKIPLNVTIDGASQTLPVGTTMYAKASTIDNRFIFTLADGREGWLQFTTENWVEIDGNPVIDCFEEVYYAG